MLKLIISMLSCTLLSSSIAANVYTANLEQSLMLGNHRHLSRAGMVMPLYEHQNMLLFGSAIGMYDSTSSLEGNFGAGLRSLSPASIVGIYGYADIRKSSLNNLHYQANLGIEYFREILELRGNVYIPLSRPYDITSKTILKQTRTAYTRSDSRETEVAQYGFDVEVGMTYGLLTGHIGYYHFEAANTKKMDGLRLRGSIRIFNHVKLLGEYSYDTVRKSTYFGGISLNVSLGKQGALGGLQSKMVSLPVRDVDIVISEYTQTHSFKVEPSSLIKTMASIDSVLVEQELEKYDSVIFYAGDNLVLKGPSLTIPANKRLSIEAGQNIMLSNVEILMSSASELILRSSTASDKGTVLFKGSSKININNQDMLNPARVEIYYNPVSKDGLHKYTNPTDFTKHIRVNGESYEPAVHSYRHENLHELAKALSSNGINLDEELKTYDEELKTYKDSYKTPAIISPFMLLNNADDFRDMRKNVGTGPQPVYYALGRDIRFPEAPYGTSNFTPIPGNFKGYLLGQGYSVYNLRMFNEYVPPDIPKRASEYNNWHHSFEPVIHISGVFASSDRARVEDITFNNIIITIDTVENSRIGVIGAAAGGCTINKVTIIGNFTARRDNSIIGGGFGDVGHNNVASNIAIKGDFIGGEKSKIGGGFGHAMDNNSANNIAIKGNFIGGNESKIGGGFGTAFSNNSANNIIVRGNVTGGNLASIGGGFGWAGVNNVANNIIVRGNVTGGNRASIGGGFGDVGHNNVANNIAIKGDFTGGEKSKIGGGFGAARNNNSGNNIIIDIDFTGNIAAGLSTSNNIIHIAATDSEERKNELRRQAVANSNAGLILLSGNVLQKSLVDREMFKALQQARLVRIMSQAPALEPIEGGLPDNIQLHVLKLLLAEDNNFELTDNHILRIIDYLRETTTRKLGSENKNIFLGYVRNTKVV
jgi:hypothetical protein